MPEHRLVTRNNKAEIAGMLVHGDVTPEGFFIRPYTHNRKQCIFEREMNRAFPIVEWYSLCQYLDTILGPVNTNDYARIRRVARVDNLYAFRNGYNLSSYNYAIYDADNDQFHFRMTIMETLRFIQIYRLPREDLPLMIGREMCKLNTKFFEHKLKGGC